MHGGFDGLVELLGVLGYPNDSGDGVWRHAAGRKLVFLGDLVDRGPKIPPVLDLVMRAVAKGTALCVPGNHDLKLMRKLRGQDVQITHGLAESLAQLAGETEEFRSQVAQFLDDLLDFAEVSGKRSISTRLHGNVTIRDENATAALEVMSRFAANPKWLIYLPPTMSPSGTSQQPGLLEHPAQTFAYFRHEGVPRVVCEEKHMGSRAVVIVCRDDEAACRRFGVVGGGYGVCFTRTGRRFFEHAAVESGFLMDIHPRPHRAIAAPP